MQKRIKVLSYAQIRLGRFVDYHNIILADLYWNIGIKPAICIKAFSDYTVLVSL